MAPGRRSGDLQSVPDGCLSPVGLAAMVVRRSTLKMRGRGGEGGNTEERRRGKELDGTGRLKEGEAVTGTARVT